MAGKVTNQRYPSSVSVPTSGGSYADIIADFPELADEIMALTAWRDVGQPDNRGTDANKIYPEFKPYPYTQ
jgi:hypothetical protein